LELKSLDIIEAFLFYLRMKNSSFSFPKEHGAYVVCIASWLLGAIFAGSLSIVPLVLPLLSVMPFFLMEGTLRDVVLHGEKRTYLLSLSVALLSIIGVAPVILLLVNEPFLWVFYAVYVLFGAIHIIGLRRHFTPTKLSIGGFIALSLLTPMTQSSITYTIDAKMIFVYWSASALFFVSSVMCVIVRLRGKKALPMGYMFIISAMIVLTGEAANSLLPPAAVYGQGLRVLEILVISLTLRRFQKLSLKTIGLIETAITSVYLTLTLLY
jgi:hypothetical protein